MVTTFLRSAFAALMLSPLPPQEKSGKKTVDYIQVLPGG